MNLGIGGPDAFDGGDGCSIPSLPGQVCKGQIQLYPEGTNLVFLFLCEIFFEYFFYEIFQLFLVGFLIVPSDLFSKVEYLDLCRENPVDGVLQNGGDQSFRFSVKLDVFQLGLLPRGHILTGRVALFQVLEEEIDQRNVGERRLGIGDGPVDPVQLLPQGGVPLQYADGILQVAGAVHGANPLSRHGFCPKQIFVGRGEPFQMGLVISAGNGLEVCLQTGGDGGSGGGLAVEAVDAGIGEDLPHPVPGLLPDGGVAEGGDHLRPVAGEAVVHQNPGVFFRRAVIPLFPGGGVAAEEEDLPGMLEDAVAGGVAASALQLFEGESQSRGAEEGTAEMTGDDQNVAEYALPAGMEEPVVLAF